MEKGELGCMYVLDLSVYIWRVLTKKDWMYVCMMYVCVYLSKKVKEHE